MKTPFYLSLFIFLLHVSCNSTEEKINQPWKYAPNDPFKNSIVQSQFFEVDTKQDNVLEGKEGTTIVIPENAFLDDKGNTIKGKIKVELAEALSLEDMILSNLTTTSNGELLETGGMIYINATQNNQALKINPKNPLYIEIPTEEKKPGMMVYKGERDENGNMNWVDPKPLENFLVTVDLDLLNFYPEGFEEEVRKGLPFRNHRIATKTLTDSLYYSLSITRLSAVEPILPSTDYNEPYYNPDSKIIDGKYTDESYMVAPTQSTTDTTVSDFIETECGIDPLNIKVIRSKKFENSFIATREFEKRLQYIFKSCNQELIGVYIQNLEKNLWECDSLAALKLKGTSWEEVFKNFASEKLTKVKNGEKYAALLKNYYVKKRKQYKEELERVHTKAMKLLEKQNEEVEKVAAEYREVLWKREKHRMETYGFRWTNVGWVNVDVPGPGTKSWKRISREIVVENGKEFDNVYSYFIFRSIKSLYRLNTADKMTFYPGNDQDKEMIMPRNEVAVCISIGYKSDSSFLGIQEFLTSETEKIIMRLKPVSKQELKNAIRPYNQYKSENRINKDLKFMEFFAKEKKRQEQLRKEAEFIDKLRKVAFACCELNGEILFQGCATCHSPYLDKKVGPGLGDATQKYDFDYLYRFTINSAKLIEQGDERAIKTFREHNGMQMPNHDLTREQVKAIFEYIDYLNKKGE